MLRLNRSAAALLAACVFQFSPASSEAATNYHVVDLGSLGGGYSVVLAINNHCQVTGYSSLASGGTHAFLYTNGAMQDLGTLGGTESHGRSINDSAHIAGDSLLSGSSVTTTDFEHAFAYTGGSLTDLGTLGGNRSSGYGINTSGQVVGWSQTAGSSATSMFLRSGGTMYNLGQSPSGGTVARAVNDVGQLVCGDYLWTPTIPNGTIGGWTPLGSLGGGSTEAVDINSSGKVVGVSRTSTGVYEGFVYHNGSMTSVGPVSSDISRGIAINDLGQVVGSATVAFIYADEQRTNLNDLISPSSGWSLFRATGINNSGWITGQGTINGQDHAYLLIPVPEPVAISTIGCAVLMLGSWGRRQR